MVYPSTCSSDILPLPQLDAELFNTLHLLFILVVTNFVYHIFIDRPIICNIINPNQLKSTETTETIEITDTSEKWEVKTDDVTYDNLSRPVTTNDNIW